MEDQPVGILVLSEAYRKAVIFPRFLACQSRGFRRVGLGNEQSLVANYQAEQWKKRHACS